MSEAIPSFLDRPKTLLGFASLNPAYNYWPALR